MDDTNELVTVWSGTLHRRGLCPGLSHVSYANGSTPLGVLVAAVVARETRYGPPTKKSNFFPNRAGG